MPRKINKRKKLQAQRRAAERKATPRRPVAAPAMPGRQAQMALIAGALSQALMEEKS